MFYSFRKTLQTYLMITILSIFTITCTQNPEQQNVEEKKNPEVILFNTEKNYYD